jgi:heme-degrading monooxygenase HmoA
LIQDRGEAELHTGGILLYVEDLKRGINKDIVPKDIFEMGSKGKTKEAVELLKDVRSHALKQPGYISGETLINHYDPCNITVVSTWQTIDDWIRWQESDERSAKEDQLEDLQEGPANFEIYDLGLVSGK